MDALFEKMKEYVKMEEEIATQEFHAYYQEVMDKLQKDYDQMDDEALFHYKLITTILAGNSSSRKSRKDQDSKKYKKMHEKSTFWSNAIEYRLKQNGHSADEIASRLETIENEM